MESMTGYGRSQGIVGQRRVTVEIKSVNHRFLELSLKMPDFLSSCEQKIRSAIRDSVARGKVDLTVSVEKNGSDPAQYELSEPAAIFYLNAAERLHVDHEVENDLTASKLLTLPGVIVPKDPKEDPAEVYQEFEPILEEALTAFHQSRRTEGERLSKDLLKKADLLSSYVKKIEERAPEIVADYKEHLLSRVRETLKDMDAEPDEARILSEVTIYSDRICIDEEIVRLKSHAASLRQILTADAPVGRKLDFLVQEMNRESNTILSKSQDVETADLGLEMKTLVEKIREQVQNIE